MPYNVYPVLFINTVKSACLLAGSKKHYAVTYKGSSHQITFIGTGDPEQCSIEMDYLFRPNYDCFTKPCSFAGIYQPPFEKNRKFSGTAVGRVITRGKNFKIIFFSILRPDLDSL